MKLLFIATVLSVGLATASALRDESEQEAKAAEKFIAGYVTRTRFSTVTSSTLKTCLVTLEQNDKCQGRKKRMAKVIPEDLKDAVDVSEIVLEPSMDELPTAIFPAKWKKKRQLVTFTATVSTLTLTSSKTSTTPPSTTTTTTTTTTTSTANFYVSFTTFTTLTTTAYFENGATTVSISYHCIPPDGINYGLCE